MNPYYKNNNNKREEEEDPKFGSPYNFVPINDDVLIPWWNDMVTHDAPLIDAESGKIHLTITNRTPLFIRDGSGKKLVVTDGNGEKLEYDYSAHIDTKDGKLYFIPGSSLRGMIRSVAEILSFSRFSMYDDAYFGMREFPKKGNANSFYKDEMENAKCGWLRMVDEKLFLQPCGEPSKYDISKDPFYARLLGDRRLNAVEKHDLIKKRKGERYPFVAGGRLVCTGSFRGKKHEYIFGSPVGPEIGLSDTLKLKFLSVYKPSPYYDFIYKSLRNGDQIPVFYKEEDGEIKHLGFTRFYRVPYRYSISSCIEQVEVDDAGYPENNDGKKVFGHDMAETLFGYVDNKAKEALKGRVWIDSAFSETAIDDSRLDKIIGVLGEPHASFYPRYLKQDDDVRTPYVTYDGRKREAPTLAGRKRYRIHSDKYLTRLPEGNGNQSVMTKFMPVPAGMKFKLTISFHNLMPEEIGLLLSAITLHGTPGFHHSIGLAKGYGYGKLDITVDKLSGLEHNKDYYLKFFEYYINNFTSFDAMLERRWHETLQVATLMKIMAEHTEGLEMMKLKDHKPATKKENKEKVLLREGEIAVNTLIEDNPPSFDLVGIAIHNAIKSHLLSTSK